MGDPVYLLCTKRARPLELDRIRTNENPWRSETRVGNRTQVGINEEHYHKQPKPGTAKQDENDTSVANLGISKVPRNDWPSRRKRHHCVSPEKKSGSGRSCRPDGRLLVSGSDMRIDDAPESKAKECISCARGAAYGRRVAALAFRLSPVEGTGKVGRASRAPQSGEAGDERNDREYIVGILVFQVPVAFPRGLVNHSLFVSRRQVHE